MNTIVAKDYNELSKIAANIAAEQVISKPESVLGFATGSTPLGMYEALVKLCLKQNVSFAGVKSFNLDEYIDLSKNNENSYYYYMMKNLFEHIDIKSENIHIPDGEAGNIDEECRKYENEIEDSGGIDFQILGIGKNGHIGFNEPNLYFEAATHRVKLDEDTIAANSRFFPNIDEVPRYAVSMGIKTIMKAKKIMLLVSGKEKAEALYKAICGPITPDVPASILQVHQDVVIVADEAAYSMLREKSFLD